MMGIVLSGVGNTAAQERDVIFYRSGPLDPASGQIGAAGVAGMPFHFELPVDVMAVEPFDVGEPVTGAPYSAQITTEILQQLADGNRIERRSMSSVSRDGEGRVRREQQLAAIGPILPQGDVQIVTIERSRRQGALFAGFRAKDGDPVADDVYEEAGRSGPRVSSRESSGSAGRVYRVAWHA